MGNFTKQVMESREFAEDWLESAEGLMLQIENILLTADRVGEKCDSPEGVRYIVLSDTLANKLANRLHKILTAGT